MIRVLLEAHFGSMTDADIKETLDLTTADIKINRIGFGRKTSLREAVQIAEISFGILQRTKKGSHVRPLRKTLYDIIPQGRGIENGGLKCQC